MFLNLGELCVNCIIVLPDMKCHVCKDYLLRVSNSPLIASLLYITYFFMND